MSVASKIDGPLFKRQRLFLMDVERLLEKFDCFEGDERELLTGLTNLLDELADEAHDVYGIDCLLEGGNNEADK